MSVGETIRPLFSPYYGNNSGMDILAKIALNAFVSFASLFAIAKLLGKKQIAELTFSDYVVGISLGSISAEWAIDDDADWRVYCIAIAVYFALSFLIAFAERKTPFLKRLLKGSPIVLISRGELDYRNLVKSKLDVNALLGMCRTAGYFNVDDIAYAVFETSGQLSILPKPGKQAATAEDVGANSGGLTLVVPVVIDGRIYDTALDQQGKTRDWLLGRLSEEKTPLCKVALATYDPTTQKLSVKRKTARSFSERMK